MLLFNNKSSISLCEVKLLKQHSDLEAGFPNVGTTGLVDSSLTIRPLPSRISAVLTFAKWKVTILGLRGKDVVMPYTVLVAVIACQSACSPALKRTCFMVHFTPK